MNNWKKAWKEELDNITPSLSDEVKNAPIPTLQETTLNQGGVAVKSRYNNKTLIISVVAVLLCLAIVGTILLVVPHQPSVNLFTVEINPSVNFAADGDGVVTGVMAANTDADVILSNKDAYENIIGKPIAEAVKNYVDYAARLGYLDLSEIGSAVRVSGCKDNRSGKLLDSVAASLQNYFTSNGIYSVVISNEVSVEEYVLRSGISIKGSLSEIANVIQTGETFAGNRNAQNMSKSELQSAYKELLGDYDGFMLNNIKSNVNKIVQSAADIKALYELNKQIEEHEDNPSWLTSINDYWMVKSIYPESSYSEEFGRLMTEMDGLLEQYKREYGVEFTDKWTLVAAKLKFDNLPVPLEELQEWVESLTVSLMEALSDVLSDVMELAGVLDRKIGKLMKLPSTVEDFVSKSLDVLQINFDKRIAEFKDIYEQTRQEISAKDYNDFIEGIISQYGSLDQYWNATR